MAERLLYQDAVIHLTYNDVTAVLCADWQAEQDAFSIQAGSLKILEAVRQQAIRKVLCDKRRVRSAWAGGSWGRMVWLPLMAEAGLTHMACVYAPYVYRPSPTPTAPIAPAQPSVMSFDTMQAAQFWLQQN